MSFRRVSTLHVPRCLPGKQYPGTVLTRETIPGYCTHPGNSTRVLYVPGKRITRFDTKVPQIAYLLKKTPLQGTMPASECAIRQLQSACDRMGNIHTSDGCTIHRRSSRYCVCHYEMLCKKSCSVQIPSVKCYLDLADRMYISAMYLPQKMYFEVDNHVGIRYARCVEILHRYHKTHHVVDYRGPGLSF